MQTSPDAQSADIEQFRAWQAAVATLGATPSVSHEACKATIGEYLRLDRDGLLAAMAPQEFEQSIRSLRDCAARTFSADTTAFLVLQGAGTLQGMGASERARELLGSRSPEESASKYERPCRELLVQIHRELGDHETARALLEELRETCPQDDYDSRAAIEGMYFEIHARTGIIDEATRALARERAAAARAKGSSAEPMVYLHAVELELARGEHEYALSLATEFETRFAGRELRAELRAIAKLYAAIAVFGIEHSSSERTDFASSHSLAVAAADPSLPIALRRLAELKLFEAAIRAGDTATARSLRDAAIRAIDDPTRPVDSIRESHVRALDVRFQRMVGAPDEVRATARAALRRALERRVEAWKLDAERVGGSGFLHHDDDRALVGELVDAWLLDATPDDASLDPTALRAWRARRGLEVLLWIQELNSLARARGAKPCSAEALRSELRRPGHGVLCYFPWRLKTHLFIVDDGGIDYVQLPARLELGREARAFVDDLAAFPGAALGDPAAFGARLLTRAKRARDLVLPKSVEQRMRTWRGVTVMGAELLHDLPFSALPLRDDSLRILGEELPIDTLSSAPLGMRLLHDHRALPNLPAGSRLSLSLFACTTTTATIVERANFENLAFPRRRALELIAADYELDGARALFDGTWTLRAWRRLASSSTDVTQIFAHSIDHPEHELSKGLAIGDGAIWYADVLSSQRASGVVLLSACSASSSAPRAGDSSLATNLGGAFMRVGARAVALSPIAIELHDHLEFLSIVHRRLIAGDSIATALCAARAAGRNATTLERITRATFSVHGLGHYPVRNRAK